MSQFRTRAEWSARAGALALETRPFIDGRYCASTAQDVIEKTNPANGEPLVSFTAGSQEDVDAAVAAARRSFESGIWSKASVDERKAVFERFVDLVAEHADELALLDTLDVGKPIRDSLSVDVPLAIGIAHHAIEVVDQLAGSVHLPDARATAVTLRLPRGVIAGIVGWNFPLVLAMQKLAPALITGNSLVLKPSELSSLSAVRLAGLAQQAGIPDGVLNVVLGRGDTVGDALAHHMDVDMLTFTGSSATGKRLLQAAGASNMKRLMLECGGKSPNVVFEDCPDLDCVADGVMARMFWNQGQVCTAGTRLIVHRTLKEPLVARLLERIGRDLRIGDPLDPDTSFGPLISHVQRAKVVGYMDAAEQQGANLRVGGRTSPHLGGGYYVAPTIFDSVLPSMTIAQEEIFGPVLSVLEFDTVDESIRIANDTIYGLSATVWTRSLDTAHRVARELRAGQIVVRSSGTASAGARFGALPLEPHGQSGIGIEGGCEGLNSYTVVKSMQIFV